LRSGFIAGDAKILKEYMVYRTYVGCACLPNGLTYRQRSVISGLGNTVLYPATSAVGWGLSNHFYGPEYSDMTEIDKKFINNGDGYDNGFIAED
jgi:hypothetical protein